MSTNKEYCQLRRIVLHGKTPKQRLAALTEMISSARPPSKALLRELLKDSKLPPKIAFTVIRELRGRTNKAGKQRPREGIPDYIQRLLDEPAKAEGTPIEGSN